MKENRLIQSTFVAAIAGSALANGAYTFSFSRFKRANTYYIWMV
jgi:hypothetical protein